jgi:hypothetical protein
LDRLQGADKNASDSSSEILFLCSTAFMERGDNSVVLGETPERMYIWRQRRECQFLEKKAIGRQNLISPHAYYS